ncbi:hypothetical protein [uncultured Croceitalea sp.]|uniref:hypothetical protein n=1 Tax=uncultured Croceitalea sp. TaxID=1798908 RepID=UPI00330632E3
MEDINAIYHNNFGVAFQWKRNSSKNMNKIQLVFRDTGLLLSKRELEQFHQNVKHSLDSQVLCIDCKKKDACKALLLDTPAPQVTLAVSFTELEAIKDLVEGTLFQLNLDGYLGTVFSL